MFGTTKGGRLLAGPGLGAREARRRRRLLLGRGLRGCGRRERLARRGAFRALLRRRRRGLVVDGEGAAAAQEALEAVLPDGALGRVEAEGRLARPVWKSSSESGYIEQMQYGDNIASMAWGA